VTLIINIIYVLIIAEKTWIHDLIIIHAHTTTKLPWLNRC